MKLFIFDCDDVLLDWQNGFAAYLRSRGIDVHIDGPAEWCLSHWIGCSPAAAKDWVMKYNASPHFGRMLAMPGAFKTLWDLDERAIRVEILTACGNDFNIQTRRMSNLAFAFSREEYLPYQRVTCLPLGSTKSDALIKYTTDFPVEDLVFVEDNFGHAKAGAALGIQSFCLRRSHNRADEAGDKDSGVIWIDALAEIKEMV